MSVEVVEYDDAWPARFTAEADQIRAALGPELRRIDHVGSTSVPGLVAKAIIDIALSVDGKLTIRRSDRAVALGVEPRFDVLSDRLTTTGRA